MNSMNQYLAEAPIGKLMRQYSVPCIISLLVGALYNIVDQIFIANASYLGSYGNAANSVVFPLTMIALALATMFGDGCCAFVSLSLGAKNPRDAGRSIGTSIAAIVGTSLVLTVLYLLFQEQILTMFGGRVNDTTFQMAKEYFFWITVGVPFYMFGQALNPVIRSDGSPRFAMASLMTGSILNVILDPVFIYAFHWGMAGAAIATILGQLVSAVMAFCYLFHLKNVKLSADCFRFRPSLLRKSVPLGATSFLSQISVVFSMAAVNNMARIYGAMDPVFGQEQYAQIPTAVIGIVMKFFQIIISVAIGLAAGLIPVVSYNVGAGQNARVRSLLRLIMKAEVIAGLVSSVFCELFPRQLIALFGAANESSYYTDFAIRCIRLFMCLLILSCVNKGSFIFLQSLGKALVSTLLSMLREIVLGVGLPILLPMFLGLSGLLYFMPLADLITFLFSFLALRAADRELQEGRNRKPGAAAVQAD